MVIKSNLSLAHNKMPCKIPIMNNPHNIYIHVPFCISKCNYCAFFSKPCKNPNWEKYENDIIDEMLFWHSKLGKVSIPTIFFGGGTPSLMPTKTFESIITKIYNLFDVMPDAEITLESNPGTINSEKLNDFYNIGMNRLSVGVQSLDDNKLKFMGRQHDVRTAIELLNNAHKKNINVSADFIYGLPNDTPDDVINLCKKINKLGLQHCSLYELTIEPNTPFGKMNLNMPNNSVMAEMYLAIQDTLHLPRYEISNYANQAHQCQHNSNIWDGGAYIGLGLGAAGRIFYNNQWYEQLGNYEKFEPLTEKSRAIEKILTGIRTNCGVKMTDDVCNLVNFDFITQNPNLLEIKDGRICATENGILILDKLILDLVK